MSPTSNHSSELKRSEVLIALGSNLGDRAAFLTFAEKEIGEHIGPVLRVATAISTEPVGAADQQFLNSALIASTTLSPLACLDHLLAIEQRAGRKREVHWGNRTLDLDILMWKNADGTMLEMHVGTLTIPHPRMREREFVMIPVREIAKGWL